MGKKSAGDDDRKEAAADSGGPRSFDIDDPELPEWIEKAAMRSGGYPYDRKLRKKVYARDLELLQIELVKLQAHVREKGWRLVLLFEGRDAAGKGGAIFTLRQYLNPRHARVVALSKPTETEMGQWYFQRYVNHLPTRGEIVMFDRSWYNRAGVEPVMGFCTPKQTARFLDEVPQFERILVEDGTLFFKYWLNIGREMQMKQFHQRRHNPLKRWKLSPIDLKALDKWDEYTAARDRMLAATDTDVAPWTIVRANDRRRARLEIIRSVLRRLDYGGKNPNVSMAPDPQIIGHGLDFLIGA